ncbi:Dcg1p [Lachancea thermotolerans CBS 6340]|uniref:KLTH0F00902p n=1 Tax=Lachancea thermotolerans (strain ATCC 56472 / CBS 6340 / NRRL Y-8284) TaxID=559295 RepID=C5DK10_LACTC|nr:KLTH0F00902p [Lachancea thermotolerans CBS 6340]CAR23811.1 KLTH0F00902p [Lachancea thermotolerans CBS 6340]
MRIVLSSADRTPPATMRILLVNPNSTEAMTQAAGARVQAYLASAYGAAAASLNVSLFTAPPDAPRMIDGEDASRESAAKCLPLLCRRAEPDALQYFDTFDGVLIACFSDHPLVHMLQQRAERATQVTCIFHASLTACLARAGARFSIITSNDEWVALLDAAAARLLGAEPPFASSKAPFKGTVASSVPVLDLHDPANLHAIAKRIYEENVVRLDTSTVILGCAGFSGMEAALSQEITKIAAQRDPGRTLHVTLVDSVISGVETLALMCRLRQDYDSNMQQI